jgi:membrane-bound lytic murein transglycosylase D
VGSSEFFEYWDGVKGRRRIVVQAKAGDTCESLGKKYGVSPATMERVNRRNRGEALREGESVVLYLPPPAGAPAGAATSSVSKAGPAQQAGGLAERGARIEPVPNGPLPEAPYPAGLPLLP